MRRHLLPLACLLGAASLLQAQIATEPFDYTAGSAFGGLNGGTGWAGPWTLNTGSDGEIAAGSIAAQNGFTSEPSHLAIDNGGSGALAETRYERPLANPVADEDGNEIYLSYYLRVDTTSDDAPQKFAAALMGFVNIDAFGAGGPAGQTVLVGRNGNSGEVVNAKIGGGTGRQEGIAEPEDRISTYDPNFIVTAVFFRGADRNDITFTWINPTGPMLDTTQADIRRGMGGGLNDLTGIGGKVTQQDPFTARFDDIRVGTTPADVFASTTLPVVLARFDAAQDAAANVVTWAAADEQDFAAYFLERATARDAATWTTISEVAPRGVAEGEVTEYSARDLAPARVSYYRLRMVDFDGYTEYSSVAVVRREGGADFRVFPNPATADKVSVDVSEGGDLTVVDASGRRVLELRLTGAGLHDLPVTDLTSGIYTVSVTSAGSVSTQRLVVR